MTEQQLRLFEVADLWFARGFEARARADRVGHEVAALAHMMCAAALRESTKRSVDDGL
jgi:hypothetical protein